MESVLKVLAVSEKSSLYGKVDEGKTFVKMGALLKQGVVINKSFDPDMSAKTQALYDFMHAQPALHGIKVKPKNKNVVPFKRAA